MILYNIVGIDDLEGVTFARCTTEAKAKKAMRLLTQNGFEDEVEIRKDNMPLDSIEINDQRINL